MSSLYLNQEDAPFLQALLAYARKRILPFHTPGHKQGRSLSSLLPKEARAFFQLDICDVLEAEQSSHSFYTVLAEAEALASHLFGSRQTLFLTNGTTLGVHAMMWATLRHGDVAVVARDSHRSVIEGLILTGATPVYVSADVDPDTGLPLGPDQGDLIQALSHAPSPRAVILTRPNYYGLAAPIDQVATVTEAAGVPLLVDEAHGPHFSFHSGLPYSALHYKADVVVQSTHKILSALTQASMLHVGRHCRTVDPQALRFAVDMLQSTSPSPLLLASLDAARHQLAAGGWADWERAIRLANWAQQEIDRMPSLSASGPLQCAQRYRRAADPTRLVVRVADLGITGPHADRYLRSRGVQVEMSDRWHIVALITPGDSEETVTGLLAGLRNLRDDIAGKRPVLEALSRSHSHPPVPELAMSPRDAVMSPTRSLPIRAARGQVVAEMVVPYPPGVPVLCPGERLDSDALDHLETLIAAGVPIRGPADPTAQTLRVVA